MTGRLIKRFAVAAAVGLLASGCATGTKSPPASAGSVASTAAKSSATPSPSASATAAAAPVPQLLILGDGVSGGMGLWGFEARNRWTALASVPEATGIARFGEQVAISSGRSVDLRSAGTPGTPGTALPVKWPRDTPTRTIVGLAESPAGNVAMVTVDGESQGYWLAAPSGTVEVLQPAPSQAFTPLVAWLDDARLLVLTTDVDQVSRLAVIDVAAQTIHPSKSVAGVRYFALSPDRRTLAVVTEAKVYADPVETFLGSNQPSVVAGIDPSTLVWGLAFDDSGRELALFSGTLAADGHVVAVRETGYAKGSASWTMAFDSPAPFSRAIDQVWLP